MNFIETRSESLRQLSPVIETRFAAKGAVGEIVGVAAGFGDHLPDSYGDTIAPGAFAASLAEHRARGTAPVMLWAHDPAEPIGLWDDVSETGKGLMVKGKINLDTTRGRETMALLKQGAVKGLSIGFMKRAADRRDDGGRRITAADLLEVSLVTFPARREAMVTEIKSARDMERVLRAAGMSRSGATKVVAGGWRALPENMHKPETMAQLARMLRATAEKL